MKKKIFMKIPKREEYIQLQDKTSFWLFLLGKSRYLNDDSQFSSLIVCKVEIVIDYENIKCFRRIHLWRFIVSNLEN